MSRALQNGWDPATAPRTPPPRKGWEPEVPDEDPDVEKQSCPQMVKSAVRDACRGMYTGFVEFCAEWFGAVHLHHFSADDMVVDVPKSAAAEEVRKMAMNGSVLRTNFHRVNPKVYGLRKGWSGAHRTQRGWGGQPNPKPENINFWRHHFGIREDEHMVTRQYLPIFSVLQSLLALVLWVVFHVRDGTAMAGLESIWPNDTDLCVQSECVDYRTQVWRWWSYQYTHVGLNHVGMNAIMVLFFGINLEGVHGWFRMFLMFNVGVFGGACCYFVSDCHTRVVGMSGGCYALIGMHFGDVLMNFAEQKKASDHFARLPEHERKDVEKVWRKMIISPTKKIACLILLVAIDLVQAYLTQGTGTSHSAHFGGFIAGFLVCIVVGENLVVKGHERIFWGVAVLTGIGCIAFSMSWLSSWPPQDIFEQVPWCWGRQVANFTSFGDNNWHCVRCADADCIARWSSQTYMETVTQRICERSGGWTVTER